MTETSKQYLLLANAEQLAQLEDVIDAACEPVADKCRRQELLELIQGAFEPRYSVHYDNVDSLATRLFDSVDEARGAGREYEDVDDCTVVAVAIPRAEDFEEEPDNADGEQTT